MEYNELIAAIIRDYLEECGYGSVDLASTQAATVELAGHRCPALITADHRLEFGSGIETIHQICGDRAIPVIFIAADSADVERALPNALFLLKPFSEQALPRAIQAAEKVSLICGKPTS